MKNVVPFWGSLAALVIGVVGGAVGDVHPARPVAMRAGYRVLEADFHAHTRFSDGFLSPFDLVDQADRRGLDVLAVTEHNVVFPARWARAYSELVHGPTIVVGEEVTTHDYHLLALGIEHRIDARRPLRAVIATVHRDGGIVAAAHPTKRFSGPFEEVVDDLDATEVMHPIAFQDQSTIGRWGEMRDFYESARARGANLAPLGDSDYHFASPLGVVRTYVFIRDTGVHEESAASVIDAIRARRTVVFDLQGKGYGDPALVSALQEEPLPPRNADYGYRGSGAVDRVTRVVGFLGLLGLIVFRRRRTVIAPAGGAAV